MPRITETTYAVRATMIDGSTFDLLLFARRKDAEEFIAQWTTQPLGFDSIEIVERQIIGTIAHRRAA